MPTSAARFMVWVDGVEFLIILTRVSVIGWVAAVPSCKEPPFLEPSVYMKSCGAHRRRNGGGPGGGYARTPAGIHLHLHVVGVGSPIAVPCMARLNVGRVKISTCDPRNLHLSGSLSTIGF
jgi:hypothetical protein